MFYCTMTISLAMVSVKKIENKLMSVYSDNLLLSLFVLAFLLEMELKMRIAILLLVALEANDILTLESKLH